MPVLLPSWQHRGGELHATRHHPAQAVRAENGFEHRRHVWAVPQPVPTVDIDHLAGNRTGGIAEQKDTQVRHVLDLAPTRGSGVQAR